MRRAVAILALAALACARSIAPEALPAERMGTARLFAGPHPSSLVFLFSNVGGWTEPWDRVASRVAESGAVVVGVDLDAYLRGLAASDDGCHYVVAEIEDLSQRLQRRFAFEGYHSPVLAGVGAGAVLAYAALAQAPAATVGGAVGVDPAASLGTRVPLCEGAPARSASEGGFSYAERDALPGWWRVDADVPAGGALERLGDDVLQAIEEHARPPSHQGALAGLPLVELPAEGSGQWMAVVYSGDGGWRDIDKDLAGVLARRGVPVVGVDSLRYFWRKKTPQQVADDLAAIIRSTRARWGRKRVAVIGYSFGAGVLPFAVNRLPADVAPSVGLVSLLGLDPHAAFEIHVSGWLGAAPAQSEPAVLPELERLDPASVQCFYGEEEDESLCRDPALSHAEIIRTAGGHHFGGDYEALAQRILDGMSRRGAAAAR